MSSRTFRQTAGQPNITLGGGGFAGHGGCVNIAGRCGSSFSLFGKNSVVLKLEIHVAPRRLLLKKILDANQTQNKAIGQKELFPHTSYIYHDGQSLYLDWSRCFCRLSLCLARSIHWIHPVLLG